MVQVEEYHLSIASHPGKGVYGVEGLATPDLFDRLAQEYGGENATALFVATAWAEAAAENIRNPQVAIDDGLRKYGWQVGGQIQLVGKGNQVVIVPHLTWGGTLGGRMEEPSFQLVEIAGWRVDPSDDTLFHKCRPLSGKWMFKGIVGGNPEEQNISFIDMYDRGNLRLTSQASMGDFELYCLFTGTVIPQPTF